MERYGLTGKFTAQPGRRDELLALLLQGAELMDAPAGCLLYLISTSPTEPDAIWVTEVWDSKEEHDASLSIPGVREIIERAMPLIAGMSDRVELTPVGGIGLPNP